MQEAITRLENGGYEEKILQMEKEAKASSGKEAYLQIYRDEDYRLGICVEMGLAGETRFRIELLVCVLRQNTTLQMDRIERSISVSRSLHSRGYALSHDDDGWISCEKVVEPKQVTTECMALIDMLGRFRD